MKRKPLPLIGVLLLFGLPSCSMVRSLKESATNGVSKLTDFALADHTPVHVKSGGHCCGFGLEVDLTELKGSRAKVVTVRAKDLKEMPTGHDRALAYQQTRHGFFGLFGGPVDFKEPKLPNSGAAPDGTLLPPKSAQ